MNGEQHEQHQPLDNDDLAKANAALQELSAADLNGDDVPELVTPIKTDDVVDELAPAIEQTTPNQNPSPKTDRTDVEQAYDQTDESAEQEQSQEQSLAYTPTLDAPNVHLHYEVTSKISGKTKVPDGDPISLLGVTRQQYQDIVERSPQQKQTGTPVWRNAISGAIENILNYGTYDKPLSDPKSKWRQHLDENLEFKGLRCGGVPLNAASGGIRLSGTDAINHMARVTRTGALLQVPCVHSGFWLTMGIPSPSSLLALEHMIQTEKYEIFRNIGGLIYSAQLAYVYRHLTKFILDHVVETTLPSSVPTSDLPKYLKITDLPAILHGLACVQYPNGYRYSTPCLASIGKCAQVITDLLNLTKMFFYDVSRITRGQAEFMSKRTGTRTLDEILAYQNKAEFNQSKAYSLTEGVSVVFKICSLEELITSSDQVIYELEQMVRDTVSDKIEPENVEAFMANHLSLTNIRQYAHFIERVNIGENWVDDKETLKKFTEFWSVNPEISGLFYDGIQEFVDKSSVCVIAIPNYSCPSCHKPVETGFRHAHLIPQDPIKLFFTLAGRKLQLSRT